MSTSRKRSAKLVGKLGSRSTAAAGLATKRLHAQLAANTEASGHGKGTATPPPFPDDSIFQRLISLAEKNTDLPPAAVSPIVFTTLGSALTRIGTVIDLGTGVLFRPNPSGVVLTAQGSDTAYLYRNIIAPVVGSVAPTPLPDLLTPLSFFDYFRISAARLPKQAHDASAGIDNPQPTCAGLLVRLDGAEWLRALNTERELGPLRSGLQRALDGLHIEGWQNKKKLVRIGPVLLSACVTASDTDFFGNVDERHLLRGILSRMTISLVRERSVDRRALYSVHGVADAARWFAEQWRTIQSGSRRYTPTVDAYAEFDRWSGHRLAVPTEHEHLLRRHVATVWQYATILAAVTNPNGSIPASAVKLATVLVDQHLDDLRESLEELVGVSDWHRGLQSVERYLLRKPEAARNQVLRTLKGCPAQDLDDYLRTIAVLHAGGSLGDHARDLMLRG
jgi:hypothetical protein